MAYTNFEQIVDNLENGTTTVASCRSVVCRLRKNTDEESLRKVIMYMNAIEAYNYRKKNTSRCENLQE